MFLIPLGLRSRILKIPFVGILVMVATIAFSIREFDKNALWIRETQQSMEKAQLLKFHKELLVDSCSQVLDEHQCFFVRNKLKEEHLKKPELFVEKFENEFAESTQDERRRLKNWLTDPKPHKAIKDDFVKTLPSYQAYLSALKKYQNRLLEAGKEQQSLMRGNVNPISLLKAMALHLGWGHLVGNMLIFALFAFFLEQRVGSLWFAGIYLLGGVGANYLQTPFLPYGIPLLGASGAVSAVIGAFAVYFWKEKMRCWLSFAFVYNRMIYMPAWAYIGFFLLVNDVVGLMNSQTSVAHLAHLGGFAIGAMIAMMQQDLFPLKTHFLFPLEQRLYYQAKEVESLEEKLNCYLKIYHINGDSFYAFRALFIYFGQQNFAYDTLSDPDKKILKAMIMGFITYSEPDPKQEMALSALTFVPLSWNLGNFKMKIGPVDILVKAETMQKRGNLIHALRFYDLFFDSYAAHPKSQDANTEVLKIFDEIEKLELPEKEQALEALLFYQEAHPENHFQTQIRHLVQQVSRAEKKKKKSHASS